MANPSPTATPNAGNYAFLNQITDVAVRNAVRQLMNENTAIRQQLEQLGRLTKPLTQILDAGRNQLKNLKDPSDPADAVTLRFLQFYVANFASAFGSEAGAGGGEPQPPGPCPPTTIADHAADVSAIWTATPVLPGSPDVDLYRFCQAVATFLETADPPFTCGLLLKSSGVNIYDCMGISYSISRVCYDNGRIFKILIDADPGGSRLPTWADNCGDDPGVYSPVATSGAC